MSATATWSTPSATSNGGARSGATAIPDRVEIRDFRPADLPAVVSLFATTWHLWPVTEAGFRHGLDSTPARARPRCLGADVVAWGASLFTFEGERTDVAFVNTTVREDVRGRGIGGELLERSLARIRADGARRALSEALDGPGQGFLERRGFAQTFERRVSALDPRTVDPDEVTRARARAAADGFDVVPFSACAPAEIHAVDSEAAPDIPQDEPMTNLPFEGWLPRYWEHPLRSLEGSFAVRHGRVVTVAFLRADAERGRTASDMTGTLRAFRGRGLARLAKLCQAEWAAAHGITQIVTENDETNRPMLAVNERLGFRPVGALYSYAREPL